jgi:hypothetical protein
MTKLSRVRRRVVVMASGLCSLAAAFPMLEHESIEWLRVPAAPVVLPCKGAQVVAIRFFVKALMHLKTDEAGETGNGA